MKPAICFSMLAWLSIGSAQGVPLPEQATVDEYLTQLIVAPGSAEDVARHCAASLEKIANLRRELETRTGDATLATDFKLFDLLGTLASGADYEPETQVWHVEAVTRAFLRRNGTATVLSPNVSMAIAIAVCAWNWNRVGIRRST